MHARMHLWDISTNFSEDAWIKKKDRMLSGRQYSHSRILKDTWPVWIWSMTAEEIALIIHLIQ